MLGMLPESVIVNGTEYELNTDYHIALLIFEALEDFELTQEEKSFIMLSLLYCDFEDLPSGDYQEAAEQASWFLNGGEDYEKEKKETLPVFSWVQDSNLIFSAVNNVAGKELRDPDLRMHWWTFLSYFSNVKEGLFSTVISIRQKQNKRKKLEKWEEDFVKENKQLIALNTRNREEQLIYEQLNRLNGGG